MNQSGRHRVQRWPILAAGDWIDGTYEVVRVVLTASGDPKEWQFLSSMGADRFLVKSVDLDDVVTLARRTIRERESTQ
jgi:DNA-binding NarL/FixJ family response regulator